LITLAADFASTPSGYVTGLGIPILALAVGWVIKRQISSNTEFRSALNASAQALAVLVEKATNDRGDLHEVVLRVDTLSTRHNDLAVSVAVLADRVNQHRRSQQVDHDDAIRRDVINHPGGM
jgi:hypothetical protein